MKNNLTKLKIDNYILSLMSAYIVVAAGLLVFKPLALNYLELDNAISIESVLIYTLVLSMPVYLLCRKKTDVFLQQCLGWIIFGYFSLNILLANAILLVIGFTLLLFPLLNWFYFKKYHQLWLVSIFMGLIAIAKILWQVSTDYLSDTSKFEIAIDQLSEQHVFIICLSIIITLVILFLLERLKKQNNRLYLFISDRRFYLIVFLGLIISYSIFFAVLMFSKSYTFSAPNFDMGIFTQAMANLSNGKGPVTTLERDKLLSHFAVHVSPILYLLVPFYKLWSQPENLEILQVLISLSGIIPFYFILRELKLTNFVKKMLLVLYLFLPTLTTSHFYDFHENCFLPPMILWLIYANIKGNPWLGTISTFLTLMIKEDAMIYVVSIYLYFMLQDRFLLFKKQAIFFTLVELVFPILYFIGCIYWLQSYGDGAMTTRFTNFMLPDQSSLMDVVVNALKNPTFVLSSLFIQRKLSYLLLLLFCMGFLPLFQKDWANYILLIPLFVINLFSDYLYQVDFGKQYNYGSSVMLLFMALLALENIDHFFKDQGKLRMSRYVTSYLSLFSVITSFFVLVKFTVPEMYLIEALLNNSDGYHAIHKTLDAIPRASNVLAYTFYTPHLADVDNLYDVFYHDGGSVDAEIDYLVVPRILLENRERQEYKVIYEYVNYGFVESRFSSEEVLVLENFE